MLVLYLYNEGVMPSAVIERLKDKTRGVVSFR
jgi:hypothetical protein